jgi:heme exporter protein C
VRIRLGLPVLVGVSFLFMVAALSLVFLWVPSEATMGDVQRIFYFHVSLAWIAFLAFFVVLVGSVLYLRKREDRWDRLAYSSAEIGVVCTTLNLISGVIWAKPVWGTWWVWDARLTTVLVLWLIYVAYLLVRAYASATQTRNFAAVVGIIGFIDVPIVFMAIRWWRTIHPGPVLESGGLSSSMFFTLIVCMIAFTLFYGVLMALRVSLRDAEEEVEALIQETRR